jgi:hypothetical protein
MPAGKPDVVLEKENEGSQVDMGIIVAGRAKARRQLTH